MKRLIDLLGGWVERVRNVPAVAFVLALQDRYGRDEGDYLSVAITYYGFFSLFPMLLLALSAIGFLLSGRPGAQAQWAGRLAGAVPGLGPLIGKNIAAVVRGRAGTGVLGLVGLLWSGTGAAEASGHALSKIFRVPEHSSFLRRKAWSISSTVGLGLLAVAGVGVAGVAAGVRHGGVTLVARVGGIALTFVLDLVLFVVAYRVLVRPPGPKFRDLWRGSVLAAGGWTALKLAGGWYASRTVAHSTAVYGTFASVVGVLVLLSVASRLFVCGAELNAVLMERTTGGDRSMRPESNDGWARGDGGGRTPEQLSTPELVGSIASDVGTLIRKEVELARQEVVEALTARVKAMAAGAAAGVVALMALVFLGLAAAAALDVVLPAWASRLIVAAAFLCVTGMAGAFAIMRMRRPTLAPEATKRTVKEDVQWARAQLKR